LGVHGAGRRFQLPSCRSAGARGGFSLLLRRVAGYARAAAWLLFGQASPRPKPWPPASVTEIVPEETCSSARALRRRSLAALPPESVRLTKQLMKRPVAAQVAEQMAEEARLFRSGCSRGKQRKDRRLHRKRNPTSRGSSDP